MPKTLFSLCSTIVARQQSRDWLAGPGQMAFDWFVPGSRCRPSDEPSTIRSENKLIRDAAKGMEVHDRFWGFLGILPRGAMTVLRPDIVLGNIPDSGLRAYRAESESLELAIRGVLIHSAYNVYLAARNAYSKSRQVCSASARSSSRSSHIRLHIGAQRPLRNIQFSPPPVWGLSPGT